MSKVLNVRWDEVIVTNKDSRICPPVMCFLSVKAAVHFYGEEIVEVLVNGKDVAVYNIPPIYKVSETGR